MCDTAFYAIMSIMKSLNVIHLAKFGLIRVIVVSLDDQIILKWPTLDLLHVVKALLCHIFAMKWGISN